MEMSAKSSLSLRFKYLVFSHLFENKKLLSILMNILILLSWFAVWRIIGIIIFIMVFIISIVFVKIIYMKVTHCSLYLTTQRYNESCPLFIVSHHTEIHPACARFILMKINDADLLLSLFIVFFCSDHSKFSLWLLTWDQSGRGSLRIQETAQAALLYFQRSGRIEKKQEKSNVSGDYAKHQCCFDSLGQFGTNFRWTC